MWAFVATKNIPADVMIQALSKKTVLISSFILMSIMFVIVMFYVNPLIDGDDGSGVLRLQLSFDKDAGIEIINSWGESGVAHFKRLFFADCLYAFTYALFLASLVSFLIIKKGKEASLIYKQVVYLSFFAGLLDCVENTMESYFIDDPLNFSSTLFFLHSIIAVVKWLAVSIVIAHIVILLAKKNVYVEKGR